jgi:four helix bundle protein
MALSVYRVTTEFPASERFGLTGQMRRAVVSVSSNIAEGAKRESDGENAHFLNIAEGSLAEVESLLRLSRDLGYGPSSTITRLIEEAEQVSRMLCALRVKIERRHRSRSRSPHSRVTAGSP